MTVKHVKIEGSETAPFIINGLPMDDARRTCTQIQEETRTCKTKLAAIDAELAKVPATKPASLSE
jgi:hypothetical protein